MKIRAIRMYLIRVPLERTFWMSLEAYKEASEILVQVETNEGITGWGEIHGRPLEKIAAIIRDVFRERLLERNPLETEAVYEDLFRTTCSRTLASFGGAGGQPHFGTSGRPQVMAAIAGIDIALWDIKGKSLGLPIYQLLGGGSNKVPVYASGGYYGPDGEAATDALTAEMACYVKCGYKTVKMKVGGLALPEDVERVRAVREVVGPDVSILLDANQGYDVPSAIDAARAFELFDIGWFEEPVHWYDTVFGLKRVASATRIPLASGESELHRWACRDLIDHAGIRIMQFDCTRAGGVSEWLKVAAYAAAHGVRMAPHHDPQIHGHLVAAAPNGYVLEVFPNRQRDPLWQELFTGRPEIRGGVAYLPDRPGFGFDIDQRALKRHGTELPF
jgi:L-alanine-DL-glutamate epimerase-like enolase superfamily enzyme